MRESCAHVLAQAIQPSVAQQEPMHEAPNEATEPM
jgi:hypothetical protein